MQLGRSRQNTIKGRFTRYDFLACDKLTPWLQHEWRRFSLRQIRARILTHHLLVRLIFPKNSPVRNKNQVITENIPTGFDLTRVLFRDTESKKSLRMDNKSFIVLKNPNHNNRQSLRSQCGTGVCARVNPYNYWERTINFCAKQSVI